MNLVLKLIVLVIWLLCIWWVVKCRNKIVAIALVLFLGPLGILLYELFGPAEHAHRAKIRIAASMFLVGLMVWAICYKSITGYYPIPSLFRWVYYVNELSESDDVDLKVIKIDEDFVFDRKGYSATAKITQAIPLVYQLGVGFENHLPMDFVFQGEILVELSKENKILYSKIINKPERNYYAFGKDFRASGISGFVFWKMPFYIAHKKYQKSKIKVTVLTEDPSIHDYIDTAILSLYPALEE